VALDQPAAGQALWQIYDETGIRPEFLIGVLAYESGLNPSLPNQAGAPFYGIGQNSAGFIAQLGIDPGDYLTWPASQQLSTVVRPYFRSQVATFGPLTSGIRVYQAEFYPASLKYATGLDDIIVSASSASGQDRAAYAANAGFDKNGKGYISPRDLGAAIASQVSKPYVQKAIADTYALRPGETPEDPVFGSGGDVTRALAWGVGIVAVTGALAYAMTRPKTRRRRRYATRYA
jgi:hypothetical protein